MDWFIQMVPLLAIVCFLAWMIGYAAGRRVRAERAIAEAPEYDLLKEVKRRRLEARLTDEIDKQVEKEAGARPVIPY